MERAVYEHMARFADTHWWYVARRRILSTVLDRLHLPADARILEIGCGTGHNLEMLSRFGRVEGVELDPSAREIASKRLGRTILEARLPDLPGITDESYDLVA